MSNDLFEQLAEQEVPPVPTTLSRGVHRRLNGALIALHVVEFVFGVMPYCAVHFVRGVLGMIVHTVFGRYPDDRNDAQSRR